MKAFKKILASTMAVMSLSTALCIPSSYASSTGTFSESESNNTFNTADIVDRDNVVISGKISSASDVDYYRVLATTSGYIDITLSVPSGCNYNFYVYSSDKSTIIAYGNTSGTGKGEIARIYASTNSPFYVRVESASGYSASTNYKLYVSSSKGLNKTWYSTSSSSADKGDFNTFNLDNDFLLNLAYDGCAITSIAMVLHNMNAKTVDNITDSRTGYTGKMYADPYTVYMASKKYPSKPTEYDITNYDSTMEQNLEDSFGVELTTVKISSLNDAKSYLNSHPEGIIVKLKQTDNPNYGMHYIVLMKSNNTDGYVVYDPATQQLSSGYGVPFTDSYSYKNMGFNKSEVDYIITVD